MGEVRGVVSYVPSGVQLGNVRNINGYSITAYLQRRVLVVKYRVRNHAGVWHSTHLTLSDAVAAIPPKSTDARQ